ncbi:MAG: hypothetical protein M3Q63_03860 [bacterium]|nr:hypothetical protein [bacterium]
MSESFRQASQLENTGEIPRSYEEGAQANLEEALEAAIALDEQTGIDSDLDAPTREDIAELDGPEQTQTAPQEIRRSREGMGKKQRLALAASLLFGLSTIGCSASASPRVTVTERDNFGNTTVDEHPVRSVFSLVREASKDTQKRLYRKNVTDYQFKHSANVKIGVTPKGIKGSIREYKSVRARGQAAEQQRNQDEDRNNNNKR